MSDNENKPVSPWMTRQEAAEYRRCSIDTIDRYRVAWKDKAPEPPFIREKMLPGGSRFQPRLWRDDVEGGLLAATN